MAYLAGPFDQGTSLEQANVFLPDFIERYNIRFAKEPEDPLDAWGLLPDNLDTSYHFSIQETRTVGADHCLSFKGQLLQLLPGCQMVPFSLDKNTPFRVLPQFA